MHYLLGIGVNITRISTSALTLSFATYPTTGIVVMAFLGSGVPSIDRQPARTCGGELLYRAWIAD